MKETHMKAAVHGVLALVGLIEAFDSRSRPRKLLTGCMTGFHIYAAYWHFFEEEEIVLDKEIEFW
jgi:hypothetical protein